MVGGDVGSLPPPSVPAHVLCFAFATSARPHTFPLYAPTAPYVFLREVQCMIIFTGASMHPYGNLDTPDAMGPWPHGQVRSH